VYSRGRATRDEDGRAFEFHLLWIALDVAKWVVSQFAVITTVKKCPPNLFIPSGSGHFACLQLTVKIP
jgi:hypothetical protein